MALLPSDLLAPSGLIEPSLFDDEDEAALEERMQAYINAAVAAGSPSDEATAAYCYYRAFLAVYILISGNPEAASHDEQGSALFHTNQAARFKDLANDWNVKWLAFTSRGVPGTNVGTGSVQNVFKW